MENSDKEKLEEAIVSVTVAEVLQRYPQAFIADRMKVNFSSTVDMISKDLYVALMTEVLSEDLAEKEISAKYPANWWEAVKERFMPEFLSKKFPVRYIEEQKSLVGKALYPEASLNDPVIKLIMSKRITS